MKFCPNCTAPIDDDAEVCVYCGSKIERTHSHPDCENAIEPELNDGGNCEDEQTNELPDQEATEAISDNQETVPALDAQYNEQSREEKTHKNILLKKVGGVLIVVAAIVIIYSLSTSTKNKSNEMSLESELQDNFGYVEESSLIDSVENTKQSESAPAEPVQPLEAWKNKAFSEPREEYDDPCTSYTIEEKDGILICEYVYDNGSEDFTIKEGNATNITANSVTFHMTVSSWPDINDYGEPVTRKSKIDEYFTIIKENGTFYVENSGERTRLEIGK